MKRNNAYFLLLVVMSLTLIVFSAGCAKKEMVKEEPVVQAPAQPSGEAEREKALAEAAAKAKAEEVARAEQMAREKQEAEAKAKAEEEAKAAREKAMVAEAAAKIEKEASRFDDIHFAFDKYDLDTEARAILAMAAKWINAHPGHDMLIEGNCDERGSIEYNIALGQRRADEAMKYLVNLGVGNSRISTVSYGKERPLDPGHDEEAWAKNRRDHFVVTLKQ
jgi:peptidoglycan-associated lipoprotein